VMEEGPKVLFVCVHNAGRSQMAAGLLDHHSKGRVEVRSAGSTPTDQINPAVIAAMDEIGIDLSMEFPKPLSDEVVEAADMVSRWAAVKRAPSSRASATSTGSCRTLPARASRRSGRSATKSTSA
jgi:arsenate reductase